MNIKAASEPLAADIIEELNRATQPLLEKLGPSFDYYENPATTGPVELHAAVDETFRPPILYDCWQCEFPQ